MSPPVRLGIDFGTSHTVAVVNRGGVTVPVLFDSSPILPSAVYAESDDSLLVGADAVNASRLEPARFEPNPKRRVDDGLILLGDREFAVEDLFSAVLTRVRQESERLLGGAVVEVTLTHPAVWGSARRLVLEDAARSAGFHDVLMVPEPIAAATFFSHELRNEVPSDSAVMVADLGGGTFDASVVVNSATGFMVRSVDGIENLGGIDIDHALFTLLDSRFGDSPGWARLTHPKTTEERRARRALYEDIRAAKERLSRHNRVEFPVPLVGRDTHITRDELEALTRPLLERAVRVTTAVVRAARLPTERRSGLLLVGGASRMPLVAGMLHTAVGTAPTVLEQPELVVAQGATLVERDKVIPPPVAIPAQAVAPDTVHRPPVKSPLIALPTVHQAIPVTPPTPMPVAPPIESMPERLPKAAKVARFLMWTHALGACFFWIPVLIDVTTYGHQYDSGSEEAFAPTLLAIGPPFLALAPIALCIAVFQFKRRVPGVRRLAFAVNVTLAGVYPILAGFIAIADDRFALLTLVLLLTFMPLSISAAVLLKTEPVSHWFNDLTVLNAQPVPEMLPQPIPTVRNIMWWHVGIGTLWTFLFVNFLGGETYYDDGDEYGRLATEDFFFAMLVSMPLLAVACLVTIGFAAIELRNRRPVNRTLAVTVNAMSVAFYAFSLISIVRFEPESYVALAVAGVVILVTLAAITVALLSTAAARRAFSAPLK